MPRSSHGDTAAVGLFRRPGHRADPLASIGIGAGGGIMEWTPDDDVWELYHLNEDWSQANDLAAEMPDTVAQMRELFAIEAARNHVLPVGAGLMTLLNPAMRIAPPYSARDFVGGITRFPEFRHPRSATSRTSSPST